VRAAVLLQAAGEEAGLPPHGLQVIPDPTLDVSQYLFHHPGVDFIWTTGGPKAVVAANAAGKPCLSVGSGNALVYLHRSADIYSDLRRRDRRVRADGRPSTERRADGGARRAVVHRRRDGGDRGISARSPPIRSSPRS
jgi:hypothetical protein